MSQPVVCLYLTGNSSDAVRDTHGTYEDWFGRLFAQHDVAVQVFDGTSGAMPDLAAFQGVVITGSPASLTKPTSWMEVAIELIRTAYGRGTPLLGVCFGHQLIGAAFGGQVVQNDQGWQLTSADVTVAPEGREDPLFDNLPEQVCVNLCHQDIVAKHTLSPRNGIRVLAGNRKAPVQVVAAGPNIRGIQFHPEFSGAVTAAYIKSRWDLLTEDAERRNDPSDMPERLLEQVRDSPDGEQVMHNFLEHFVLG